MPNYKQAFILHLNQEGIRYTDVAANRVKIKYSGDNASDITVDVIFDEDGEALVALRCWSFGTIPKDRYAKALITCNQMNVKYRWIKFAVDNDSDLALSLDAVVDIDTVGAECLQLVRRMVNIYDEAYPTFMNLVWG